MSSEEKCLECGSNQSLMRCARCKVAVYCSKEHQKTHWKKHKKLCISKEKAVEAIKAELYGATGVSSKTTNISSAGLRTALSGDEDLASITRNLIPNLHMGGSSSTESVMRPASVGTIVQSENVVKPKKSTVADFQEFSLLSQKVQAYGQEDQNCTQLIRDLNAHGMCVLDGFLGEEQGLKVLNEVLDMYNKGVFREGQVVSLKDANTHKVRTDKITWISGKESGCDNIKELVQKIDSLVLRANRTPNNGVLGNYTINGRTGAMVACYPGSGSHYVKHVDNPNHDGRCITAIYYLNRDWDILKCGGLLRVYPEGNMDKVANVEPIFDRMLFFWSDRRNPHEVQPAFNTRYAITLWFFDAIEREQACRQFADERNKAAMNKPPPT